MKKFLAVFVQIILFTNLISCGGETEETLDSVHSEFDSPYTKRPVNLTWRMGSQFSVKSAGDTIQYTVYYDRKTKINTVIEGESDTIFSGQVSKLKDFYLFNERQPDSSYWIYAVKVENFTICGLNTAEYQMKQWDERFDYILKDSMQIGYKNPPTLKAVYPSQQRIVLTPDKKGFREFYTTALNSLYADTIIQIMHAIPDSATEAEDLPHKNHQTKKLVERCYPNPAEMYLNIEIAGNDTLDYMLFNSLGQTYFVGLLVPGTTRFL